MQLLLGTTTSAGLITTVLVTGRLRPSSKRSLAGAVTALCLRQVSIQRAYRATIFSTYL
jgi:hypothetical protein